jgi:thioredoxin 1
MSNLTNLTEDAFDAEALKSDIPVVIDFYADWCGPCKMVAPIMDVLSVKYAGKVKFFKVNIDEQRKLAITHKVMSIPTLFFIKDGEIRDKITGAVPQPVLEEKIEVLLK